MSTSAVGGLIFIILFVGFYTWQYYDNKRWKRYYDKRIEEEMIKGNMEQAESLVKIRSSFK